MANTNIKIPEKHYVAMQVRQSECPLGFLVPWGTDKAAQKRMSTADNWATGWGGQIEHLEPKTINNDLMSGFKLASDSIRRGQSSTHWRVIDPRGFELEINSENMANLIKLTTIENGEFLSRCVWARRGANNVLLPEESKEYQDALTNTKRIQTNVKMKDVNIGDKIILTNGQELVSLGRLYTVFQAYGDSNNGEGEVLHTNNKTRHYFYSEEIDLGWRDGPSIISVSSPKISSIIASDFMEIEDTAKFINDKVQNFEVQVVTLSGDSDYRFVGVSKNKFDLNLISFELEEIEDIIAACDDVENKSKTFKIYLHTNTVIANIDKNWVKMDLDTVETHGGNHQWNDPTIIDYDKLYNECKFVYKTVNMRSTYGGIHTRQAKLDFKNKDAKWFWPLVIFIDPKTNIESKLRMI